MPPNVSEEYPANTWDLVIRFRFALSLHEEAPNQFTRFCIPQLQVSMILEPV